MGNYVARIFPAGRFGKGRVRSEKFYELAGAQAYIVNNIGAKESACIDVMQYNASKPVLNAFILFHPTETVPERRWEYLMSVINKE